MAALAAASSAPAWAQCSPDPTVPGGVTLCAGTDSDGLRVTTDDSTVQVAESARVVGAGGSAITVDIPRPPESAIQHSATIRVGGVVDGGAHSGITVLPGSILPDSYDYYGTYATVSVAAGATVTGTIGITTEPSPGNYYGQAVVSLSNAGTIKGTGGVSMLATAPGRGGFAAIDNAAGGTIGAIVGNIGTLNNAGVIDGGAFSAIDETAVYNSWIYHAGWTNSGTIRSASDTATLANIYSSVDSLTNSGTIANTGTGAAIEGTSNGSRLTIVNLAGGSISTAGSPAIVAASINLRNAGTITGDIVTEPAFGTYFFSIIDSTKGVINGNVSLGGGNDLVHGRYDGTQTLVTGINGTLDAGAGTNILVLAAETDLTVSTAITLPNSFQRLRLAPGEGITMTLAQGFVAPGTIELDGYGTLINETAIQTAGQAFVVPYSVSGEPSLINRGSIDASPTSYYYAVDLDSSGALNNSGTITSSGLGVSSSGEMINSGSIIATDTAVSMFNGTFNNSGTIRSTGDIGIDLSGNTDNMPAINTGRIEGASYGAITGYVLSNSGTISATGAGTAVGLDGYGVLNNLAGGMIEGGSWAVTGHDPYGSTRTYNATVYNAGTINGDVTFVAPDDIYGGNNNNSYVALAGGVLNGNLTLGEGDVLVTDMANDGEGQFAGINGTVTTTGGLLRYRVSGETSAVVGAVGPFATTGYELLAGAHLTLTAAAPQVQPLVLAGDGTVDVSIDISVADQPAMQIVAAALPPQTTQDPDQQLHIISRGTVSGVKTDYYSGSFGVVSLGVHNVLQNEGTIKAAGISIYGGDARNAAVVFGGRVINNGRIELDGSYGTYAVKTVVNTGTIVQTGSHTSYGIVDAATVLNSGIIETAGAAILNSSGVITNSGTIRSTETAAISNIFRLDNLAGGTITGGNGTAIRIAEAIVNAGTIIGNVDTGHGNAGSVYYAAGGTLAGDLTFGSANDLFLQTGDETGVSGLIDAGAGRDIYGIALTSSDTVSVGPAPGIGFEDAMVAALGANTVATITAVDGAYTNLYAAGDGTVVNTLSVAGQVLMGRPSNPGQASILGATLGTLNNTGAIAGGVSGAVTQLLNSGIISTTPSDGVAAPAAVRVYNSYFQTGTPHSAIFNAETGTITASGTSAVAVQAWGVSLALENAGLIEASGTGALAIEAAFASTVTVHNSGTILGEVVLGKGNDLVVNSGTMGSIDLGAGDDTLRLVGGSFAGSIAGGDGRDIVEIAGGEARFAAISDVETLRMSAGAASFSGSMSFDEITLTGGRLVGLEGSAITAPTISVARDAIFGSAGTVNGNLAVWGMLSPGASPGTMTVSGNVSLASSSTSIFEITPTVSDKLIVNGNLTISEGATLRVDAIEIVNPGQSRDLIIADSISGRFTNTILSGSLFGVIVQQDHSISLLGQFVNDPSFTPQVQRSISYVNSLLVSGTASDAFLSAAPELDEAGFAQLTPEAYASAGQIVVEHGLELAHIGRGAAFAANRDTPGAFTFAGALGNTRTLNNGAEGTARTRIEGFGLLAGIGWGSSDWSIGGFVGHLNSRQTLSSLGARSEVDSIVAGAHGRWTNGQLSIKATVAYDGSNADTRRDLPAGAARGNYGLSGWTGDVSLDYTMPVGSNWTARPSLGVTFIGVSRDFVSETGDSVYALEVARERDHAIFVDGALAFRGGMQEGSIVRPHVSVGVRYQVDGRNPFAIAAMDGGGFGMGAAGARRAPLLGTATAGADIALNSNLMMFAAANAEAGNADRRLGAYWRACDWHSDKHEATTELPHVNSWEDILTSRLPIN